eukprot:TRINITY_DN102371_c0_g1_i1.p1 TRINITY_DN102371_c0_g1~~TRINITY_DN102371_c0_g1_i1.p1  ORF type:complete len:286 (+),score=44.79 TRINITY_DN102371_c0_g1_i1:53-910(+)
MSGKLRLLVCCLPMVAFGQLRVIGAGHGRTGTDSMKLALEQLGFGPTYHMKEVLGVSDNSLNLAHKERHMDAWGEATAGPPDFDKLFLNYSSAVDAPAVMWFGELLKKYPDAKIILTKRSSAEAWAKSIDGAMCRFIDMQRPLAWLRSTAYFKAIHPSWARFRRMHDSMDKAASRWLGQEHNWEHACRDSQYAEGLIEAWNRRVEELVPAQQLLVFETGKHGWKELCSFLDVPEPAIPYPRVNSSADFAFICNIFTVEVILIYSLPVLLFLLLRWLTRRGKAKSA